jgi:hypothetical protein
MQILQVQTHDVMSLRRAGGDSEVGMKKTAFKGRDACFPFGGMNGDHLHMSAARIRISAACERGLSTRLGCLA